MKSIQVLILVVLLGSFKESFSQEKNLLNIVYEFTHKQDADKKNDFVKSTFVLSVGNRTSRFVDSEIYNRNTKDARKLLKKRQEETATALSNPNTVRATGKPVFTITNSGPSVKEEIFIDRVENRIINSGRIGFKTFYYSATLPVLKFDLQPQRRSIMGYDCQKALASFGGRTYELWFTTQLPYSFGPWKLQGLPGLILEARDTKGEISFLVKDISKNNDDEELVDQYLDSDDAYEVKRKEYLKTVKMFMESPENVISAQFPNTKVAIKNKENPSEKTIPKVKKYNPVEL